MVDGSSYLNREREKLNYEITDLKQRAQDITFLKVTRNVQEYLACEDDAAFEAQKQREAQMLETTITKMKEVCSRPMMNIDWMRRLFSSSASKSNERRKKMKLIIYNMIISH